jgi:hypothetical protein
LHPVALSAMKLYFYTNNGKGAGKLCFGGKGAGSFSVHLRLFLISMILLWHEAFNICWTCTGCGLHRFKLPSVQQN